MEHFANHFAAVSFTRHHRRCSLLPLFHFLCSSTCTCHIVKPSFLQLPFPDHWPFVERQITLTEKKNPRLQLRPMLMG
jgi:hypothetical protein